MKASSQCPKCLGKHLYVIDEAKVPNYEFSNSVEPFTLFAHYGAYGEKGFLGGSKQSRALVKCEAWVCAGCGYSELYSTSLDTLKMFAFDGLIREVIG